MDTIPLNAFIASALKNQRIRFGDVQRVRRALPGGITERQDADLLLSLDRVAKADPAWTEFLTTEIRRFILRCDGAERTETAQWLVRILGDRPTKCGLAIRADLAAAFRERDPSFAALFAEPGRAKNQPVRRMKATPPMAFATISADHGFADDPDIAAPALAGDDIDSCPSLVPGIGSGPFAECARLD